MPMFATYIIVPKVCIFFLSPIYSCKNTLSYAILFATYTIVPKVCNFNKKYPIYSCKNALSLKNIPKSLFFVQFT